MPDWTRNEVHISGRAVDVKALREALASADTPFDFNNLIPMPAELADIVSGSWKIDGERVAVWREVAGEPTRIPQSELDRMQREHGAVSWYDWCNQNWGTKWNAIDAVVYEEDAGRIVYIFDTAWSGPDPIAAELRERFPNVNISWMCTDEGCVEYSL